MFKTYSKALLYMAISLFFLCLFLNWPLLAEEGYSADRPLRVGVILPLSGENASIGMGLQNAVKMAVDDLPVEARERLVVYVEDDGLVSRNSVSAFHKLVTQNRIDALINVSSGTANALAPLAEQRGIPFIAIASDPKIVEGRKNVFNFWVTPLEQAKLVVPEALRRGYKRIARISTIHDFTLAANRDFDDLNQGRIEIVVDQEYPMEVTDFRSSIARIRREKDLDAVFIFLFKGQLSSFAMQARQGGIDLPFFGYEFMEDVSEIRAAQGALDGAWYVNAADPDDEFMERFKKLHPDSTVFAVGNGYDAIMLFARAIETARSKAEIVDFLATLKDFEGVVGTFSATGDHRFTLPAVIKEVTGESVRRVSED